MSHLENFIFANAKKKTVSNQTKHRRSKLIKAINTQKQVLAATVSGERYKVPAKNGSKQRVVAAWFFAQDSGYYVRCRYGFRNLHFDQSSDALFVGDLGGVGSALNALAAAADSGELDEAIAESIARGRP